MDKFLVLLLKSQSRSVFGRRTRLSPHSYYFLLRVESGPLKPRRLSDRQILMHETGGGCDVIGAFK